MASSSLPVGMQLEKVHKFLKAELRPLTSAEIQEATGVDIDGNSEILQSLTDAASRVGQEKDGRWRWNSEFFLRNFNELLALMVRSPDGIAERRLLDAYKGVAADIEKLKKRGVVYEIKAGTRVVLYPRDGRMELDVSQDVRDKYNSIRLPDALDVHRELVDAGLKDSDGAGGAISISQPVARKRPKRQVQRKARRIKLTNTHMANSGIDLNKDFKHGKDSAFG